MDAVGPGGGVVPGRAGGGGGNPSSEYGIAAADGSFELPGCQQRTAQEQGDEAHRQQGWHSEVAPACRCRCPESLFHANRLLSGHRSGHWFPLCATSSECRTVRVCHRRIGAVSEVPVSRARSEALRRLRGSVEFGGCSRGDVLGSAVRRPLTEAFADPAVASRVFGLRGRLCSIAGVALSEPVLTAQPPSASCRWMDHSGTSPTGWGSMTMHS